MDLKEICEAEENEITNENAELKQFYEQELSVLLNHPLDKIPLFLLRKMGEKLHGIDSSEGYWQEIVYKMGLKSNQEIRNVALYSRLATELPITFALKGPLSHSRSYGHIIKCLLEEEMFDVLRELRPFTENLVSEEQNSSFSSKTLFYELYPNLQSSTDFTKDDPKESLKEEMLLEKNSVVAQKNEKQSLIVKLPKEPECLTSITAFIPHTTADERTAQNVLRELQKEGIMGKLLSELEHLFAINRTRALSAILCEVDFIIPIISEAYLQQVSPPVCGAQDEETANNCYIFNQLCSEQLWSGYMNYRVRPVLVPEFDRGLLNSHGFLRDCALRLCEVQKLPRILKCTKPLIRKIKS